MLRHISIPFLSAFMHSRWLSKEVSENRLAFTGVDARIVKFRASAFEWPPFDPGRLPQIVYFVPVQVFGFNGAFFAFWPKILNENDLKSLKKLDKKRRRINK